MPQLVKKFPLNFEPSRLCLGVAGAFFYPLGFPTKLLYAFLFSLFVLMCDLLLTYLLTPWNRVPLEKLTGSAASQEIPRIFGTRRFLTVPTSARHLSLS